MQLDSQEKQVKMKIEREEDYQAHEVELQSMKDTAAYDRELLKVYSAASMATGATVDEDNDGTPDFLELKRLDHEIEIKRRTLDQGDKKLSLEEKKLKQDKELKEKEIAVKKIQARKKPTSK